MVTTPEEIEREATTAEKVVGTVLDQAYLAKEAATGFLSDRAGRLRRPLLFLVVGISLVLNLPALGVAALLLLAYTDEVA
jgi:hypothetical protein